VDYQRWDEQLEQDIADGKLEALAEEAIAEFKAGHCREIWCTIQREDFGSATRLSPETFRKQQINVMSFWKSTHPIHHCTSKKLGRSTGQFGQD
jgi:hypothetical protein